MEEERKAVQVEVGAPRLLLLLCGDGTVLGLVVVGLLGW